jgi:glycerol-3-phosphate dehydrogenase (NAD+)
MWVYEEMVDVQGESRKLTEVINSQHENVKYLPGVKLPHNIVAVPDLAQACKDATLLIFVLPHQFLPRLLPTIRENCHSSCRGVSLIKGLGECLIDMLHYVPMQSVSHDSFALFLQTFAKKLASHC